MKKILFSVLVIVLVTGLVIGGAFAWFSDTEESDEFVITGGTIDISCQSENPWTGTAVVDFPVDFKPCMIGTIDFEVANVGSNPAVVWKHVIITGRSGGVEEYLAMDSQYYSSEPEFEAEATGRVDNLDAVINYDMTSLGAVMEGDSEYGSPDGVIFVDADEVTMGKVECLWMPVGTVMPGEVLDVHQSYHIQSDAGNEYQGDVVTFTIELYAEQRNAPGPTESPNNKLFLDNKSCEDDWDFVVDDTWAILEYNEQSEGDFTYDLRANNVNPNTYDLVWWDDATATQTTLVSGLVPDGDGNILSSGATGIAVGGNAKIWLCATDLSNYDTLWEANLIYQT